MASLMVKSAMDMLGRWTASTIAGNPNINVEQRSSTLPARSSRRRASVSATTAAARCWTNCDPPAHPLQLQPPCGRALQQNRGRNQTLEARRLGKEIDEAMLSIIEARRRSKGGDHQGDLLGLLLAENYGDGGRRRGRALTTRELVDECKTFFFAGHETTALALTWTMLLLAVHKDWQEKLREEIKGVVGEGEVNPYQAHGIKKR
ncbi:unnamed protein product [Thlaspi arvense]|uniref:Uncharacterized protein n=1 Tax=Thlaspi arvense TaxID=13288 RepID=A0AAU9S5S7_THLAR|nr:unnamed protein product [Thlaspi arvense]